MKKLVLSLIAILSLNINAQAEKKVILQLLNKSLIIVPLLLKLNMIIVPERNLLNVITIV